MALNGTDLYIGGGFVRVGPLSAKYIARWNGSAWSALAGGTSGFISSMAFIGNDLYVTGPLLSANGSTVNYVARWAGTNWYTLGSGLNGLGSALAASGTDLYVGGNFTATGPNPSYYFGIWHKPRPQANNTTMPNGNQLIVWSSEPGENYQVLSTADLSRPFVPISGIITATGYTTSFLDASVPGLVRYYEIAELR
jgi:hypothetical protein